LGGCIRALVAANEAAAGGIRRPCLPRDIVRGHRLPEWNVRLRNQHIHRVHLRGLNRLRLLVGSAREIGGKAAGTDCDGQDDNACGIHTLHFPRYAAALAPS